MAEYVRKGPRLGWLIAFFAAGMAVWFIATLLIKDQEFYSSTRISANNPSLESDVDLSILDPSLSPADIVTKQVESMRAAVSDPEKLIICYSLASADNRKQTGPFSRFSQLVMSAPYDRIAKCAEWQMGETIHSEGYAMVLVTTISSEGAMDAFRFILQKHLSNTVSCWQTDGVQLLQLVTTEQPIDERNKDESSR
jgi:hypothetical protein